MGPAGSLPAPLSSRLSIVRHFSVRHRKVVTSAGLEAMFGACSRDVSVMAKREALFAEKRAETAAMEKVIPAAEP